MSTEQFVSALTEYKLDPTEIAEILWLALREPEKFDVSDVDQENKDPDDNLELEDVDDDNLDLENGNEEDAGNEEDDDNDNQNDEVDEPDFGVAPELPSGKLPQKALPISIPDPDILDETLPLVRALKPILKQIDSQFCSSVNEAETVERIAETDIWSPILEPDQEPWYEVALVIDSSPAMDLWQRLIQDIRRLLRCYGSFRDFRVWQLNVKQGEVGICAAPDPVLRSPNALLTPDARRLILVFSDCTANYWWDGSLQPILSLWGDSTPTAIWQVLPDWMWKRTALGIGEYVAVRSRTPGAKNTKLTPIYMSLRSTVNRGRRRSDQEPDQTQETQSSSPVCIPIITSDSEYLGAWSRMLAGDRRYSAPGFMLPSTGWSATPTSSELESEEIVDGLLEDFRLRATPEARRLAALLSAAPVITLPVMRLIRASDEFLPGSSPLPVAEVFLGGLLTKAPEQPPELESEVVQYLFPETVRNRLLDVLPNVDKLEVIEKVSQHVAERLNCTLADFQALLLSPDLKDEVDQYGLKAFAKVTAQILRTAGSDFAEIVRQLESQQRQDDSGLENRQNEVAWLEGFTHETLTYQVSEYINFPELEAFEFDEGVLANDIEILPKVPLTTLLISFDERSPKADQYFVDAWLVPNPKNYNAQTGEGVQYLSTLDINRYGNGSSDSRLSEGITFQDIPSVLASLLEQARTQTEKTVFTIHLFLPQSLLDLPIEQMGIPSLSNTDDPIGIGRDCNFVVLRLKERVESLQYTQKLQLQWAQLQERWNDNSNDAFDNWPFGQPEDLISLSQGSRLGLTLGSGFQSAEVRGVLENGTPIVLWSRKEKITDNWQQFLNENILNGTMEQIPMKVFAVRLAATEDNPLFHWARDLAFLWDDPLLVPPSQQDIFPPPLQTGDFTILRLQPEESISDAINVESFDFTVAKLILSQKKWETEQHQQSANRYIERLLDKIDLEMVSIPAGTFMMGSPNTEPERLVREGPQHQVTVESFFIGRYPITQAQWRVVANQPQIERELETDPARFKGDNRPIEKVSWFDAIEFCDRLSRYTGREYRLPTEAEWEYACRAGTTTPFHFGDMITTDVANYSGSAFVDGPKGERRGETTPIDYFSFANAFGLSDMHGNVWEWCQDYWHVNYYDAPTDGSAWLSENESTRRMRRGGSWLGPPRNCRSASRLNDGPGGRDNLIGFRVVCSAPRSLP
ncbi:SAV_2336 N-terminal domain-related protein [Acaryochloris marina]|uniref:Conserved domain protein n=1 Tax=Acaryochloris marina (strain MBIC 11017) TaxID=329726 RepID=A8ZLF8_ACAM1|nr:SAV_2336 N-terminal domain-related protein [Acaryochloris marina]ABW31985.1 conserved domain protein [Acaryochloris marina MBIC11017]